MKIFRRMLFLVGGKELDYVRLSKVKEQRTGDRICLSEIGYTHKYSTSSNKNDEIGKKADKFGTMSQEASKKAATISHERYLEASKKALNVKFQ